MEARIVIDVKLNDEKLLVGLVDVLHEVVGLVAEDERVRVEGLDRLTVTRDGALWVRYEGLFTSRQAAESARDAVERLYHPAGYGTTFHIVDPVRVGDLWSMTGSRYTSCD